MKLELKHLAPYIPYNLQGIDEISNYYYLYSVDTRMRHFDLWMNGNFHKFDGRTVKPILHPLSDLIKEIEVNGEKFVPVKKLEWGKTRYFDVMKYRNIGIEITLNESQKLYEWHFDIYGLIENNFQKLH